MLQWPAILGDAPMTEGRLQNESMDIYFHMAIAYKGKYGRQVFFSVFSNWSVCSLHQILE